eukprot:TRINITY_DN8255_c0_g1_i1.p1 TRINITY_DN8255_c0_g1~~TRINITY_DN8255_c0_g1_i1.p1  ORF type:complete len:263 (+),score=121.94 TRINITY_DN8255_c0_g1_i1:63-851(+)
MPLVFAMRAAPLFRGQLRQARFCTAGSATAKDAQDVLEVLGARRSVPVAAVMNELNVTQARVDAAIAELEAKHDIVRYRRKGQWDVLVKTPDELVTSVLAQHSSKALLSDLEALAAQVAKNRDSLAGMDAIKRECDELAARYPNLFAGGGLLGMVGLWALLFWMVFGNAVFGGDVFTFDWNLVEPITYFLGYSVVWISVFYYYLTGAEYTYDSVRDILTEKKRAKLYASRGFDVAAYTQLQAEVASGAKKLAELNAIKASAM